MTPLFLLARRNARAQVTGLALLLFAACRGEEKAFLSPDPTVPTQRIASLTISPRVGTVAPGEVLRFSAIAATASGAQVQTEIDWTATGGTIAPDGTFQSGNLGRFSVTARVRSQAELADSAVVSVFGSPNDVIALELTPDSTEVVEGDPLRFKVAAGLANGSTTSTVAVEWSATGGTIDPNGSFVGSSTGSYLVAARAAGGVEATAQVVVRSKDRLLNSVVLAPATVNLEIGQSQAFVATFKYADGGSETGKVTWRATGGSVNGNGLYVAGSTPGNYRVIGTHRTGLADTAYISILPPVIVSLNVSPDSSTLQPSASLQYSAKATMSDGSVKAVGVTWRASGGDIASAGLYTAPPSTGEFRVIADVAGTTFSDTSSVTVAQPAATLSAIILNPSTVSLPAGTSRQFTVTGQYSDGTTGTPAVKWSATGGTIAAGGLYTAGSTQGTYQVIARDTASGRADTSSIAITAPVVTALSLSPASFSLTTGGSQTLTVSAEYSDGSAGAALVTWASAGGSVSGGVFTAGGTAGTFAVIATAAGGEADTSFATITAPAATLTGMSLTPSAVNLELGETRQFYVSGTWSDGGTGAPPVTWSQTGGSITSGGLYTAGSTAGTFKVIARHTGGTLADTSVITVSASSAVVTKVTVSPGAVTIAPTASRQFTASANWSDGSTSTPTVTWSATGGTITNAGLFVAGTATGSYRVFALHSSSGRADTAEVSIEAPSLQSIQVTPGAATVSTGQAQQFSASGTYSDGSTAAIAVTWSATGGTVSSGGLYTAGTSTGAFRVVATQQGGTKADTAEVSIQPPPTPGTLPAAYDPARLGSALLAGQAWQGLALGSTSLINWGNQLPRQWVGGTPPATLASIVSDPTFGKVYKMVQPAWSKVQTYGWPTTIQLIHYLPSGNSRIWMRAVLKADGQGNGAFTSYGTKVTGGSTTYKMLFLRAADGQQRHEFELYNGGDFLHMGSTKPGNNFPGETSVRLSQGQAPVPPITRGANQLAGTQPLAGWLNTADNGGNFLSSKDWYEFIVSYEYTNGTVLQRFFLRRLTVGGVWSPATYPAWIGWRTTGSQPRDYTEVFLGANKSQSNDGPDDQVLYFGPFEISNAVDPYGWDKYGR